MGSVDVSKGADWRSGTQWWRRASGFVQGSSQLLSGVQNLLCFAWRPNSQIVSEGRTYDRVVVAEPNRENLATSSDITITLNQKDDLPALVYQCLYVITLSHLSNFNAKAPIALTIITRNPEFNGLKCHDTLVHIKFVQCSLASFHLTFQRFCNIWWLTFHNTALQETAVVSTGPMAKAGPASSAPVDSTDSRNFQRPDHETSRSKFIPTHSAKTYLREWIDGNTVHCTASTDLEAGLAETYSHTCVLVFQELWKLIRQSSGVIQSMERLAMKNSLERLVLWTDSFTSGQLDRALGRS